MHRILTAAIVFGFGFVAPVAHATSQMDPFVHDSAATRLAKQFGDLRGAVTVEKALRNIAAASLAVEKKDVVYRSPNRRGMAFHQTAFTDDIRTSSIAVGPRLVAPKTNIRVIYTANAPIQ